MSADDNIELSGARVEIKLLDLMKDIYLGVASFGYCRHRKVGGPSSLVDVSSDATTGATARSCSMI